MDLGWISQVVEGSFFFSSFFFLCLLFPFFLKKFFSENCREGLHALEYAGSLLQTVTDVWFRIKNLSCKDLNHLIGGNKVKSSF